MNELRRFSRSDSREVPLPPISEKGEVPLPLPRCRGKNAGAGRTGAGAGSGQKGEDAGKIHGGNRQLATELTAAHQVNLCPTCRRELGARPLTVPVGRRRVRLCRRCAIERGRAIAARLGRRLDPFADAAFDAILRGLEERYPCDRGGPAP